MPTAIPAAAQTANPTPWSPSPPVDMPTANPATPPIIGSPRRAAAFLIRIPVGRVTATQSPTCAPARFKASVLTMEPSVAPWQTLPVSSGAPGIPAFPGLSTTCTFPSTATLSTSPSYSAISPSLSKANSQTFPSIHFRYKLQREDRPVNERDQPQVPVSHADAMTR